MSTDTATTTTTAILVDDVTVGARVLYPHQQRNGAPVDLPVRVVAVVEYPATRVLYFAEGGYGVADRTVELELAPADEAPAEFIAVRRP